MVFLPIVEREFRRAAKRGRMFYVRLLAAVGAAMAGMIAVHDLTTWSTSASAGRTLFGLLSAFSFWLCLCVGVFTTSVSLSEEKRHGTLGLLFLTDLKGYDVVGGKLANVSLASTQTLMGIFPVLALSMVLGGVSAGEFWRMTLVLLNTLLFSLATGMCASALSVRPGRAIAATAALLTLLTVPSALIDHFMFSDLRRFGTDYVLPGPWQAYALVWDGRYGLAPGGFWPSLLFTFALSVAQLSLASRIIVRAVQQKVYPALLVTWLRSWRLRTTADLSGLQKARRRMLRINPVFWLEVRHRSRWFYIWGLLALVLAGWLLALAYLGFTGERMSFAVFMCLTPALHAVLKIAIAAVAANHLSEARQNGELEALLVTPMRTRRICQGHILALQRQFALPVILVLIIDAGLLLFGSFLIIETAEEEVVRSLAIWAMMIMLILDAHALSWLGLWEGLRSKNAFAATRKTLLKVLFLPWPAFLATAFVAPPVLLFGPALGAFSGWFLGAAIWWSIIGFMVDYFFYSRSARMLTDDFRTVAAEWFVPRPTRKGPGGAFALSRRRSQPGLQPH